MTTESLYIPEVVGMLLTRVLAIISDVMG